MMYSTGSGFDHCDINSLLVLFPLLMTLLPQEDQHRMSAAITDEGELEELSKDASLTDLLKGTKLIRLTVEPGTYVECVNYHSLSEVHLGLVANLGD